MQVGAVLGYLLPPWFRSTKVQVDQALGEAGQPSVSYIEQVSQTEGFVPQNWAQFVTIFCCYKVWSNISCTVRVIELVTSTSTSSSLSLPLPRLMVALDVVSLASPGC